MTLRNRMERAGFRRDDWGDWFQIVAGCGIGILNGVKGSMCVFEPANGRACGFIDDNRGLPDLSQRAKAAARKLARKIGSERREARKGMR